MVSTWAAITAAAKVTRREITEHGTILAGTACFDNPQT